MQVQDPDQLQRQFNVNVVGGGEGDVTLVMVHGFGCNQAMWHHMVPRLSTQYRLVMLDLMGCGLSDVSGYNRDRYAHFSAHVEDVLSVVGAFGGDDRIVLVGHSLGAAICVEASLRANDVLAAMVLVSSSPYYLNESGYSGGFERDQIHDVIAAIAEDRSGWAESFAGMVVGRDYGNQLARQFVTSVCDMHEPAVEPLLRHAFLWDQRATLARVRVPTLIVQASHDPLVPSAVGEYMQSQIRGSELRVLRNTGHSPHLTAPRECALAIRNYLGNRGLY